MLKRLPLRPRTAPARVAQLGEDHVEEKCVPFYVVWVKHPAQQAGRISTGSSPVHGGWRRGLGIGMALWVA